MNFLVDECCDAGLVASLRKDGHDVNYVLEEMPGASDDEVLITAYNEERILITEDKGFGELVYRLKKPCKGIILLRFSVNEKQIKWARLKKLLSHHEHRLPGSFVVIDAEKFRFRPLMFLITDPG